MNVARRGSHTYNRRCVEYNQRTVEALGQLLAYAMRTRADSTLRRRWLTLARAEDFPRKVHGLPSGEMGAESPIPHQSLTINMTIKSVSVLQLG